MGLRKRRSATFKEKKRERHFDQARTSLRSSGNVTSMDEARHRDNWSTAQGYSLHGAGIFSARHTQKKTSRPPVTPLKPRCTKGLRHGRCALNTSRTPPVTTHPQETSGLFLRNLLKNKCKKVWIWAGIFAIVQFVLYLCKRYATNHQLAARGPQNQRNPLK